MATAFLNTSSSSNIHRLSDRSIPSPPWFSPSPTFPPPSPLHLRSFLLLATPSTGRRLAVAPGPPSPPGPEPPPPRNTNELAGLARSVSMIQDRVRIFLAVLFWMSLFFWTSASDGRGKGKGKRKRKKGSHLE